MKQRRQELGFEGVDMEVQKRRDILERSKGYTQEDVTVRFIHLCASCPPVFELMNCQILDDSKYLVHSKSDASKVYEVDIEAYTCTCDDYPVISYCKHICAVQQLYEDDGSPRVPSCPQESDGARSTNPEGNGMQSSVPQDNNASSPHVPSLSTLPADVSATLRIERTPQVKLDVLATIAEQFERLGARFRRPTIFKIEALDLDGLRAVLDNVLRTTDNGSLLPSAQSLAPVVKPPTARQTMLPNTKTRRVHAGDPSYGAGATSGSLAKPDARGQRGTKKARTSALVPLPTIPAAPLLTIPAAPIFSTATLPPTTNVPTPPARNVQAPHPYPSNNPYHCYYPTVPMPMSGYPFPSSYYPSPNRPA
jgi:hypothetical protein